MEQEKKYLKVDVKEFENFLTEFGKSFTYAQAAPFMNKFSHFMPYWLRLAEDDADRIASLSKMLKTATAELDSAKERLCELSEALSKEEASNKDLLCAVQVREDMVADMRSQLSFKDARIDELTKVCKETARELLSYNMHAADPECKDKLLEEYAKLANEETTNEC